ncbi:MAG TPA: hypothetical protein VK864_15205, partial [Longimicrobiales bacterium]|nr:hypothetical protein [Longimicrobiales bacterium]
MDHNENHPAAQEHGGSAGVRLVQSDWDGFLDQQLAAEADAFDDQFVPSPFNPHLALGWLMRDLRTQQPGVELTLERFSAMPETLFKEQRAHGTLVASHADWICPVHCIEPEVCPHTRGPRDWDMDNT